MAETEVWLKQVGIQFLVAEDEMLICIHKQLLKVYIKATVNASTL
jgi:hypothetical protein